MRHLMKVIGLATIGILALAASCPTDTPPIAPGNVQQPAATTPTTNAGPTKVTISFYGAIGHLLEREKPKRAVLLRHNHHAWMEVSTDDIRKQDLETVFGASKVQCPGKKPKRCVVRIEDTSIEFMAKGVTIAQPSSVSTDGSFDELVPQLSKVTGGKMKGVDPDAWKPVETSNQLISASIDLPDGALFAIPYTDVAEFDVDHEADGERFFAREVVLTSTIDTPSLRIYTGQGNWRTLPVQSSNGLELRIVNAAMGGTLQEHWDMHYDLAVNPRLAPNNKNDRPELTGTRKTYPPKTYLHEAVAKGRPQGLAMPSLYMFMEVPGCSNSTWP